MTHVPNRLSYCVVILSVSNVMTIVFKYDTPDYL